MIRISPGRSGSEYWTRIRPHTSFIFDAPKQNSNADACRTVRNAVPDADAGSVVRYRMVPHLKIRYRREGGRADPDFGPDPRLNPQTGYHIFFKLNKKYERIHSKVGADPHFSLKIHV